MLKTIFQLNGIELNREGVGEMEGEKEREREDSCHLRIKAVPSSVHLLRKECPAPTVPPVHPPTPPPHQAGAIVPFASANRSPWQQESPPNRLPFIHSFVLGLLPPITNTVPHWSRFSGFRVPLVKIVNLRSCSVKK